MLIKNINYYIFLYYLQKKEAGKTERRPFNRDIDLKLNMFDPEKKSRMMKNACLLDDKFSTGKSKYL